MYGGRDSIYESLECIHLTYSRESAGRDIAIVDVSAPKPKTHLFAEQFAMLLHIPRSIDTQDPNKAACPEEP